MIRKLANLIDRLTYAEAHVFTWRSHRCMMCGGKTHWLEMSFEAALHRGFCTNKAWADYERELRK